MPIPGFREARGVLGGEAPDEGIEPFSAIPRAPKPIAAELDGGNARLEEGRGGAVILREAEPIGLLAGDPEVVVHARALEGSPPSLEAPIRGEHVLAGAPQLYARRIARRIEVEDRESLPSCIARDPGPGSERGGLARGAPSPLLGAQEYEAQRDGTSLAPLLGAGGEQPSLSQGQGQAVGPFGGLGRIDPGVHGHYDGELVVAQAFYGDLYTAGVRVAVLCVEKGARAGLEARFAERGLDVFEGRFLAGAPFGARAQGMDRAEARAEIGTGGGHFGTGAYDGREKHRGSQYRPGDGYRRALSHAFENRERPAASSILFAPAP